MPISRSFLSLVLPLSILCVLIPGSVGTTDHHSRASSFKIFLTNRIGQDIIIGGGCQSVVEMQVAKNEIKSVHCADPTAVQIGLQTYPAISVDTTQEGHFSLVLQSSADCQQLLGAFETVTGLIPSVKNYYVYVWEIQECEK